MSFLRLSIILNRTAGLPTVWSNCLAGWWLGGGGNPRRLPFLFAGATLLYLGGTFLNDAFDGKFDRQPCGAQVTTAFAFRGWGLVFLALGAVMLFWLGKVTGGFGVALAFCIILCYVIPRLAVFSGLLAGVSRLFLYLIAASTGTNGITGWAIWCGLALAVYVVGVNCFMRQEKAAGLGRHWPILLLAVPILLALIMNDDGRREAGLLLSAILALWTIRCLRHALWTAEKDFAASVSGLLAGIVFVDLLAVADAPKVISLIFFLLFGATCLFQRRSAA